MSGFISYPYAVSVVGGGGGAVGGELLAGETDALGIDFTYHADTSKQLYISDLTTPANNYNGSPQGKLTYTSPSAKLCRQSDGVWRYGNHNLCLQSQDFDQAPWVIAATVTANTTVAPDGTTTADTLDFTGSFQSARQPLTVVSSTAYVFSFWCKVGTISNLNYSVFDSTNAADIVVSTSYFSSVNSSTFTRVSVAFTTPATCTLINVYVGRDNGVTGTAFFWGAQVKRAPVNDAGGFTYATGYLATAAAAKYDLPYEWSAALASQGILIEEARTNLLLQSQTLDNATWLKENSAISVNAATAPDGTATGDALVENSATGRHVAYQQIIDGLSTQFTISGFVKAHTAGSARFLHLNVITGANNWAAATYSLSGSGSVTQTQGGATSGTVNATSITAEANGWYRFVLTATIGATNPYLLFGLSNTGTPSLDTSGDPSYTGDNTSGLALWGLNFSRAAFASSPIHTIAATVTRAVDNITLLASAFPYSTTVGTLVVALREGDLPTAGGLYRYIASIRQSSNDFMSLMERSGNPNFEMWAGAANQMAGADGLDLGTVAVSSDNKIAAAWAANDLAGVYNGGTVQTDGTATMPTWATPTLQFGQSNAGSDSFNGYIRQVTYLKRRATNAELQQRTT